MEPLDKRKVIEGLVGFEHQRLYFNNPWFKMAVDQFVDFLPFLVNGLAGQALERQADMDRRTEAMRHVVANGTALLAGLALPPKEGE